MFDIQNTNCVLYIVDIIFLYTILYLLFMNVSIKDDIPPSTNNDEVITINSTNLDNSTIKNKPKDADKKPKSIKVEWSPENELIMVEWCDVAQCYKWMNARAHSKYSRLHAWYTIPAIIFSTLSGTASFAQSSIPDSYKQYAPHNTSNPEFQKFTAQGMTDKLTKFLNAI